MHLSILDRTLRNRFSTPIDVERLFEAIDAVLAGPPRNPPLDEVQ